MAKEVLERHDKNKDGVRPQPPRLFLLQPPRVLPRAAARRRPRTSRPHAFCARQGPVGGRDRTLGRRRVAWLGNPPTARYNARRALVACEGMRKIKI